jgi:hypothetical protein
MYISIWASCSFTEVYNSGLTESVKPVISLMSPLHILHPTSYFPKGLCLSAWERSARPQVEALRCHAGHAHDSMRKVKVYWPLCLTN